VKLAWLETHVSTSFKSPSRGHRPGSSWINPHRSLNHPGWSTILRLLQSGRNVFRLDWSSTIISRKPICIDTSIPPLGCAPWVHRLLSGGADFLSQPTMHNHQQCNLRTNNATSPPLWWSNIVPKLADIALKTFSFLGKIHPLPTSANQLEILVLWIVGICRLTLYYLPNLARPSPTLCMKQSYQCL
jgi:hypothetical protein